METLSLIKRRFWRWLTKHRGTDTSLDDFIEGIFDEVEEENLIRTRKEARRKQFETGQESPKLDDFINAFFNKIN